MSVLTLGDFHDVRFVRAGVVADLFSAVRNSTGERVAVELYLPSSDASAAADRAREDLAVAASLQGHPHIVRIHDVLDEDSSVYVVTEWVDGVTLADWLDDPAGRQSVGEVTAVAGELAHALGAIHATGLVHGALSPESVLLTSGPFGSPSVKLAHVGLLALTTASAQAIDYAAPEDLGLNAPTAASDVYALAATLLHAQLGRPAMLDERLNGITALLADTPEPLRTVIERCMQGSSADRPNAAEVAALLGSPATGATAAAMVVPPTALTASLPTPGDVTPGNDEAAVELPAAPSSASPLPPPAGFPAPSIGTRPASPAAFASAQGDDDERRWQTWRPVGAMLGLVALSVATLALTWGGHDEPSPTATAVTVRPVRTTTGATLPATTPTTAPAATTTSTTSPATTIGSVATTTTTTSPATTTTPATTVAVTVAPTNPFGDPVGSPVTAPSSAAGRFAVALQRQADASSVAVEHSDAFYFLLWSSLTGQSANPSADPLATDSGYRVQLGMGTLDLSDFAESEGRITGFTATIDGAPVDIVGGLAPTGVCVPSPDECDGAAAAPFVRSVRGTGGRLFTLATVTFDPATVSVIVLPDVPGASVTSGSADFAEVFVDQGTALAVLRYSRNPDPGTAVRVELIGADDRSFVFRLPVS